MTLSLSLTDSADGTGGTATIAGTSGASVTAYYLPYSAPGTWLTAPAMTRTGDGTVPIAVNAGQYFLYAATSTLQTPPQSFAFTDATQSVWYRCLAAIQTQIQGLGLSGINTSTSVVVRWVPRVLEDIDNSLLPMVQIFPWQYEAMPPDGGTTGKDDVEYPCGVALMDAANKGYATNVARNLLWRQQVHRHFRRQRLAGVPEVMLVNVEPKLVLDPVQWDVNLFFSGLVLRCMSREVRG